MDTVKGKRVTKRMLLVLTERLTRNEIKLPLADGTTESVVRALDMLERRYGTTFRKIFKTITVDNGSEFADCAGMERSISGGQRTKLYYCHPYSSWERGSNENQNKLIRRWIPKGTPIENYSDENLRRIETWLNDYPRAIFGGLSAGDLFEKHVAALAD
jgi:IS30 family transposase